MHRTIKRIDRIVWSQIVKYESSEEKREGGEEGENLKNKRITTCYMLVKNANFAEIFGLFCVRDTWDFRGAKRILIPSISIEPPTSWFHW